MKVMTRNIGLDVIRGLAVFFVIGGHFFLLNTSLREVPFEGISLFVQSTFLSLLLAGVPLFIILTGYLNINKSAGWKYYKNSKKVLYSYLLFSILTILFRKYDAGSTESWTEWGLKILDFSAIPYAWYIEMWIGLYLLTPFLNILYKNMDSRNAKLLLIGILFLMTTLPHWLNRDGMHLLPGYWQRCWPLTFYFAGAYIQEYQPQIKLRTAALVITGLCLLNPVLNLLLQTPSLLLLGGGPEDVVYFFITVWLFLMLYRIKIKSKMIEKVMVNLSLCSLDIYLCCYIFDALYYPFFKSRFYVSQEQFGIYFFILVPLVLVSSFLVAYLKHLLQRRMRVGS